MVCPRCEIDGVCVCLVTPGGPRHAWTRHDRRPSLGPDLQVGAVIRGLPGFQDYLLAVDPADAHLKQESSPAETFR